MHYQLIIQSMRVLALGDGWGDIFACHWNCNSQATSDPVTWNGGRADILLDTNTYRVKIDL